MASPSYSSATQLSYSAPETEGPLFDQLVTDELLARIPTVVNATERCKVAYVTQGGLPPIAFVDSGGAVASGAMQFAASDEFQLRHIAWQADYAGDVLRQMGQVVDLQSRLAAVLFGQVLMGAAFASPPSPLFPKNIAYFAAQNPLGTFAAGGVAPTVDHLLRLRRLVQPNATAGNLVFVMNTRCFDALEQTAAAAARPLPYHRNPDTGQLHAYVGSIEVLRCDHIPTDAAQQSSVYAIRLKDPRDLAGVEGLSFLFGPQGGGIRVSAPVPLGDGHDTYRVNLEMHVMAKAGSRTSVAVGTGFAVAA